MQTQTFGARNRVTRLTSGSSSDRRKGNALQDRARCKVRQKQHKHCLTLYTKKTLGGRSCSPSLMRPGQRESEALDDWTAVTNHTCTGAVPDVLAASSSSSHLFADSSFLHATPPRLSTTGASSCSCPLLQTGVAVQRLLSADDRQVLRITCIPLPEGNSTDYNKLL